jgi:beta-phosphoglucomutase-like phosphatase (HAD superfamily)
VLAREEAKEEAFMSRLAICDFDGVIADIAEHTKIAQERAKAFVLQQTPSLDKEAERKALSRFFYSERGFFDTRLIEHDQLMSGCHQALARLSREYDKIVVVTSRPPSMREATLQWFSRWCPGYEHIEFIFKDIEESVLKTASWKARLVAHFARQHDILLFIDDDERNRKAVEALAADLPNVTISIMPCFEECLRDAD